MREPKKILIVDEEYRFLDEADNDNVAVEEAKEFCDTNDDKPVFIYKLIKKVYKGPAPFEVESYE